MNSLRRSVTLLLALALCACLLSATALALEEPPAAGSSEEGRIVDGRWVPAFRYLHDPMENPKAATEIVRNPGAVFGYSPNPDSVRLGVYADAIDWSDDAAVAAARAERAAYHAKNAQLYAMIEQMKAAGSGTEEIARAVSRRRNELRLESYDNDPNGLALLKKSNLQTYGNEEGPTAESLFEKYGSWEIVLEKALSSNAGMDACLGFYDELYPTYAISARPNPSTGAARP